MICLSECHVDDKLQVEDLFRNNGFHASYNPSEQADVFTHGRTHTPARTHTLDDHLNRHYFGDMEHQ